MKFKLVAYVAILATVCLCAIAVASLGNTKPASYDTNATPMVMASIKSSWTTVIDAGLPATADAATITNPASQVTRSGTHAYSMVSRVGMYLQVRLAYDTDLALPTSPVVKVFGRRTGSTTWELLRNNSGSKSATLTIANDDLSDGTLKYTTPDYATNVWDTSGCEELLIGIETALSGTGVVNNSLIQARLL